MNMQDKANLELATKGDLFAAIDKARNDIIRAIVITALTGIALLTAILIWLK